MADDGAVAPVRLVGFDICNANAFRAEHTTSKETSGFIEVFLSKKIGASGKLNGESLNG
jgi:hypothetical protein